MESRRYSSLSLRKVPTIAIYNLSSRYVSLISSPLSHSLLESFGHHNRTANPNQVFYASMLDILDDKALTVIFANIEDLLLTATSFLSELEQRQKSCRLYMV
jgi:hypothetical protein